MATYSEVKMGDDSVHPLVTKPHYTDVEGDDSTESPMTYRPKNNRKRFFLFHAAALALNLLICFGFISWYRSPGASGFRYFVSRIQRTIGQEDQHFDLSGIYLPDGSVNPNRPAFGGTPRPELIDSWANLTQYMNIRLQPEELGEGNEDDNAIIQLTDGSGAYGSLAVTHAIHCMSRIHRYLYPDYYYPNITGHDFILLKGHTEHCIDWLRQYVICNADLTIMPMYWGTNQARPLASDVYSHKCANWDALYEWQRERAFNVYEPGLLMHPLFGSPYTSQSANKLGIVVGEVLLQHDESKDHH